MHSWRRAIGFGVLVWLMPFAVAFTALSLKESWRSLFESLMAFTVAVTVVAFAALYFRRYPASVNEAIKLGLLWMAISIAIDLPLMLSPPINYTFAEYCADIGLTYAMMPLITLAFALGRRV